MTFQPTDRGYDTNAAGRSRSAQAGDRTAWVPHDRPDPPRPNGFLSFPGEERCWLWVYELKTGFSLAGSQGQSRRTRSYFPHNFVQPSFTVMCQCANQEIYARTAEFIRHTQVSFESSVHLWVVSTATYARNQRIRGPHSSNVAEGYIKSVRREHGRFIYAPDLSFDFVVEKHLQPSEWRDDNDVTQRVLPSWKDIIETGATAPSYAQDSDEDLLDSNTVTHQTLLAPGPGGSGERPT